MMSSRASPRAQRSIARATAGRIPAFRDSPEAGRELEEGGDLHFRVQRRALWQIPDPPPDLEGGLGDVQTADQHPPLGGRHEAGDDPHGGGLPGAVRPQEAEDLSLRDAEAEVRYRECFPVALGDPVHQYQGFHGCFEERALGGVRYSQALVPGLAGHDRSGSLYWRRS